jgi:hypothetical protein
MHELLELVSIQARGILHQDDIVPGKGTKGGKKEQALWSSLKGYVKSRRIQTYLHKAAVKRAGL